MSIKICFIFVVVLAISFVHSLPKLSGATEGNTQLMALMQSFNARAPSLRALQKKDKSGSAESEESIDGYIDMVFDLLFDLEKDSSEEDVDLAFGPEFNPEQFFVRLNDDIDKAFQRKCKKISGRDDTYSRIKAATKELGQCLKRFVKSEEVRAAYTNLNSEEDAYSVFRLWCRKRNVPFKCLDEYIAVDEQCSFPSEIAFTNSIRRIFYGIWDVVCANHGNDFIAMVSGSGRECIMEHLDELKTCQNKELYAIVKGLVVKLIEYETFELKMDAEDCKAFDEVQSCVVSSVENCVDPAPKNYFASIYQVIYNETECSTATPIQVKLLK